MDSRIYFHQYRRPRNNNPTYVSSNVSTSMTFFNDKTYQGANHHNDRNHTYQQNQDYNQQYNQQGGSYERYLQGQPLGDTGSGYSGNAKYQNAEQPRYSTIHASNKLHEANYAGSSLQTTHPRISQSQPKNTSNLSSYGSNSISLNQNALSLNQNDIFNKQNSKFNIITMQPKQFDTSIRQFPKYTLENKDELYYKRMADQLQKRKGYEEVYGYGSRSGRDNNASTSMPYPNFIAGKHTYETDKSLSSSQHNTGNRNYPSHMQNPQSALNPSNNPSILNHPTFNSKQFTPKMLNHMDELASLS